MKKTKNLTELIRSIPDFPKPGILFRDITTLLKDSGGFASSIDLMAENFNKGDIDFVVAAEARGFIFGAALAYKLNAGFVPVRKKGKLPFKTYEATYDLEYGKDSLTIHQDAFGKGAKVLIVDDLLATGGTVKAAVDLVSKLGADVVAICFLIELTDLNGREKLKGFPIYSLIKY